MNYIKKLKPSKKLQKCLLVAADFETILLNKKHYVFCITYTIDNKNYVFYINTKKLSINTIEEESHLLIKKFLLFLHKLPNKKKIVYFHNLSNFDGFFINNTIKKLINYDKELITNYKSIFKNNKIYKIQYYNIMFLDSYTLLPASLNELSKTFLNESKIIFDIKNITLSTLVKDRISIIEYALKDSNLLYNIIITLRNLIFDKYKIDIINCLSIANLAFTLFRTNFYTHETIYKSNTNLYNYIKKAFYGGISNVYKPKGTNLYHYDINSLYPYCMQNYPMPVGKPKWIYNSKQLKELDLNTFFGFLTVKVTVPYMNRPPLPMHKDGFLIHPYGTFEGTFFSEELKFAISANVKIEHISMAVEFEKEYIFTNFVHSLYKERLHALRHNQKASNYIYKLLMNSLYGRFAMKPQLEETKFVNNRSKLLIDVLYPNFDYSFLTQEPVNLISYEHVTDSLLDIEIVNNLPLDQKIKNSLSYLHMKASFKRTNLNISIQISAAITAYGRIKLLKDINNLEKLQKVNLYYVDTDSIILDKPLPLDWVSQKLGFYKQVDFKVHGIFLAPKVYILNHKNYKKIIFKGLPNAQTRKLTYKWFTTVLQSLNPFNFEVFTFVKNKLNYTLHTHKHNKIFKWTFNKRVRIFKNTQWIDTKPIQINK